MPESTRPRLVHRSMADEVAAELRRMIHSGELPAGERITQDKLAKELGVSTMPVREALLRLATEGLIIGEPNRSFTVASNTEEDQRDMFWLYATLCAEIARRAAGHMTDEIAERLAELHQQHVDNIDDPEKRFEANWQFFRTVNRTSHSERLTLMLQLTLRYFPQIIEATPTSPALATKWQRDLLRALTKRDAAKAEAASHRYATLVGDEYLAARRSARSH